MKDLKITAPTGYEVDKDKSTFEHIVFKEVNNVYKNMSEVFSYHNTTEKEFLQKYSILEPDELGYKLERMIVNFYNKGVKCDFNDKSSKYYPYFYLGDNFRFDDSRWNGSCSTVAASLCFKNKADLEDAVIKFIDVYKMSRNS